MTPIENTNMGAGDREYAPDTPIPPAGPHPMVELYAFELREMATATQSYQIPTEVAARYKTACYQAASILAQAGAELRPYLATSLPRRSLVKEILWDIVVPALIGVALAFIIKQFI